MRQRRVVRALAAVGLVVTFLPAGRTPTSAAAPSHSAQAPGRVAAIAGQQGGQDIFGGVAGAVAPFRDPRFGRVFAQHWYPR